MSNLSGKTWSLLLLAWTSLDQSINMIKVNNTLIYGDLNKVGQGLDCFYEYIMKAKMEDFQVIPWKFSVDYKRI